MVDPSQEQVREKPHRWTDDFFGLFDITDVIRFKSRFRERMPSEIIAHPQTGKGGLFLGPIQSQASLTALAAELGVQTILQCDMLTEAEASASDLAGETTSIATATNQKIFIERMSFPFFDHSATDAEIGSVVTYAKLSDRVNAIHEMRGKGMPVVVTCQAGKGRSSLVAQAVLIREGKLPSEAASAVQVRKEAQVPSLFAKKPGKKILNSEQEGVLGIYSLHQLADAQKDSELHRKFTEKLKEDPRAAAREVLPALCMNHDFMKENDRDEVFVKFAKLQERFQSQEPKQDLFDQLGQELLEPKYQQDGNRYFLMLTNYARIRLAYIEKIPDEAERNRSMESLSKFLSGAKQHFEKNQSAGTRFWNGLKGLFGAKTKPASFVTFQNVATQVATAAKTAADAAAAAAAKAAAEAPPRGAAPAIRKSRSEATENKNIAEVGEAKKSSEPQAPTPFSTHPGPG